MSSSLARVLLRLGLWGLAGCRLESHSAGLDPDPNAIASIRIAPGVANLVPADTIRFRATAITIRGESLAAQGLTFESTGGSIDAAGLFLAATVGDFDVQARLRIGSAELVSTAHVSVRTPPPPPQPPPPALIGLTIEPDTVTLAPSAEQIFLARARYADGTLQLGL